MNAAIREQLTLGEQVREASFARAHADAAREVRATGRARDTTGLE